MIGASAGRGWVGWPSRCLCVGRVARRIAGGARLPSHARNGWTGRSALGYRPAAHSGTREIGAADRRPCRYDRGSSTLEGAGHGQEDRRLHQAADPGRQGEPVAAGGPGAGSARPEHHGVRQGIQRRHAGHGARDADPGGDHRVRRPDLHVRDEDAAEHLLPEEGGGDHRRARRRRARVRRSAG